jgi:polygalacturonase
MKQSFDARRGFLKTATVAGLALSGPGRALAAAVPDPWKAAAGIAQRLANPVKFRKAEYLVTDFGAAPCKLVPVKAWVSFEDQADLPTPAPGAQDCYAAFWAAIEYCDAVGGGRVVIP